jgi:hypothetical protein
MRVEGKQTSRTVFFVMFQREFQTFLVVISIISAIWMLAAKPAIIKITQRRSTRVRRRLNVGGNVNTALF